MTVEINHWDHRAEQLKQQELAGKINARINSQKARKRADELTTRLDKRIKDLQQERNISSLPPYLSQFVNTNHEQLNDIYMKSREQVGPGILSFKVDDSDNRVDVKYMVDEELLQSMDREALEGLYRQAKQNGDKKFMDLNRYGLQSGLKKGYALNSS